MAVVLRRDADVGRAHNPAGSASDQSYKLLSVEVIHELKPVRKIRAISLTDDTRYELALTALMLPFITMVVLDLACVPLWAAIPGTAVITMSMITTVITFATHPRTKR